MKTNSTVKNILGVATTVTIGLAGLVLPVSAEDTTVTLNVNAGVLFMYAGDNVDNNDLCEIGNTSQDNPFINDAGTAGSVDCGAPEQTVSLSGVSVLASRQNSTATINDILFEDLSGSDNNAYAVSATISNLINGSGGSNIVLGSNPDSVADDTDADAPSSTGDEGKVFCTIDPSVGSIAAIAPETAKTDAGFVNFDPGAKTTVISTSTSIDIFDTQTLDVLPGRYDLDASTYKCRIPAFVDAGSYTQTIAFTIAAT